MSTKFPEEPSHADGDGDGNGAASDAEAQTEEVLSRVERGELTTDAAEGWAKERRRPPFTGRPDPSTFDPRSSLRWTPLQAVAWIAYRDDEEVRNVSTEFRQHWFVWLPGPSPVSASYLLLLLGAGMTPESLDGSHIEQLPPASFETFCDPKQRVAGGLAAQEEQSSSGDKGSKADQARDELWSALNKREIRATGFIDGRRQRSVIPAIEWNDLEFAPHAPDVVCNRHGLTYKDVRIKSDEILTRWQVRTDYDDPLREAARLNGGILTRNDAKKILQERQVHLSQRKLAKTLERLKIAAEPGRPSKAR